MDINLGTEGTEIFAVKLTKLILTILQYIMAGLMNKNIGIMDIEKFAVELTMLIVTVHFCYCFLKFVFEK